MSQALICWLSAVAVAVVQTSVPVAVAAEYPSSLPSRSLPVSVFLQPLDRVALAVKTALA